MDYWPDPEDQMSIYLTSISKGFIKHQSHYKQSKFANTFLNEFGQNVTFTSFYLYHLFDYYKLDQSFGDNLPISILDVGCGLCNYYFGDQFNSTNLVYKGVDKSDVCKQIIESKGCQFKVMNLEDKYLDIPSESAHIIVCSHVIEHISNAEDLLSNLYRILKPNGFILIRTPDVAKMRFNFYSDYTHIRPFTLTSLEQITLHSGFKILQCKSVTPLKSLSQKLFKNYSFTLKRLLLYICGLYSQSFCDNRREIELIAVKES